MLSILCLAFLGCDQYNIVENKTIYGLWEYRFSYNEFENDWEEVDTPLWALISEQFYKERFSQYSNTDSNCFSDWTVIDNSSVSRSWSINGMTLLLPIFRWIWKLLQLLKHIKIL